MKKLFIDTSAWIAVVSLEDVHHQRAVDLWPKMFRAYERLISTNMVVSETYTFLRGQVGFRPAWGFLEKIDQTSRLEVINSDVILETKAKHLLKQYQDQDFSYTDAVSFAAILELGIKDAFAFDKHFKTAGFNVIS